MRISDWSSDVCSSDLDAGEIGLRETHLAQPVEPSCMSPLAAQRADIEGFRAQRHGERRIVELRIVSQGDNGGAAVGCERRQRVVRPFLRQRDAGKAFRCREGAARRSEEHTSELQSLMRISYAVFCLKKKKQ